jgi:hypothetical protein
MDAIVLRSIDRKERTVGIRRKILENRLEKKFSYNFGRETITEVCACKKECIEMG